MLNEEQMKSARHLRSLRAYADVKKMTIDQELREERQRRFQEIDAEIAITAARLHNSGVSITNVGKLGLGTKNYNTARDAVMRGLEMIETGEVKS